MAPEAPGATKTPKTTDFRSLNKFKFSSQSAATSMLGVPFSSFVTWSKNALRGMTFDAEDELEDDLENGL